MVVNLNCSSARIYEDSTKTEDLNEAKNAVVSLNVPFPSIQWSTIECVNGCYFKRQNAIKMSESGTGSLSLVQNGRTYKEDPSDLVPFTFTAVVDPTMCIKKEIVDQGPYPYLKFEAGDSFCVFPERTFKLLFYASAAYYVSYDGLSEPILWPGATEVLRDTMATDSQGYGGIVFAGEGPFAQVGSWCALNSPRYYSNLGCTNVKAWVEAKFTTTIALLDDSESVVGPECKIYEASGCEEVEEGQYSSIGEFIVPLSVTCIIENGIYRRN